MKYHVVIDKVTRVDNEDSFTETFECVHISEAYDHHWQASDVLEWMLDNNMYPGNEEVEYQITVEEEDTISECYADGVGSTTTLTRQLNRDL